MLNLLEPACRAMFIEELGFAPAGPSQGYRQRVAAQLAERAIMALIDPASGQVVFKAEFGAQYGSWVQIQGVWTASDWRGRGFGKAGMAAMVLEARRRGWTNVCLYVNDFNAPALAVYRAVGFRRVGTWATVMF
jgi:predicted GNAT family acetyltransferase